MIQNPMQIEAKAMIPGLAGGSYTISEASRLLKIPHSGRIRGWLSGYPKRAPALIDRQYQPQGRESEIGFWDLLEIRFIEHFRRKGVSMQSLRSAAALARLELKTQHPFATAASRFMTDRHRIFLHTALKTGDQCLLDLTQGQFAMYDVIEQTLAADIEFDSAHGLAQRWRPDRVRFPDVLIDPHVAFGQPALSGLQVTTSAILRTWKAENNDLEAVSDWYEVPRELVEQAIAYETALAT
jgi:uncharacterized protein (DUF433 family)